VLTDKKACSNTPPIARIESLASLLSISKVELIEISKNIESLWKPGKLLQKKNGEPRPTIDAKPALKKLHEKIKNRMLKQVDYPSYLLGGIEDKMSPRDYKRHAEIHSGKSILISEDVKDFFPSSSIEIVNNIWKNIFRCTSEVAALLTTITTLNGSLPQGWKTSGYLANLVFWDLEPELVRKLTTRGFSYSRFMDDITVSCKTRINNKSKTFVIKEVYRMLFLRGYAPKRSKHQIDSSGKRMEVTGLVINDKNPSLPKKIQNNIKAAVHNCECHAINDRTSVTYEGLWNSASGHVGTLKRFHPEKAARLRERLRAVKPVK
jgi:hypothetical protein